jgi:hypothetical protein
MYVMDVYKSMYVHVFSNPTMYVLNYDRFLRYTLLELEEFCYNYSEPKIYLQYNML